MLGTNIGVFIKALQEQGLFDVEALVGDFYDQNSIGRYRFYWGEGKQAFVAACAAAVKVHGLSGLNFGVLLCVLIALRPILTARCVPG